MTGKAKEMTGKAKEMTGFTFGRLTVVEKSFVKNETVYWKCKCKCGKNFEVCGSSLRRKKRPTISCGCLQKEAASLMHIFTDNRKLTLKQLRFSIIKNQILRSAKSRNLNYNISDIVLEKITNEMCFYCNSKPSNCLSVKRIEMPKIFYQGIDRIDNSFGYEDGNIRPCCKICNYAKGVLKEEDFKQHIIKIYKNWIK